MTGNVALFITSIPDIFVTIFFARILQGYHRNGPLTAAPSSIGRIALTVLLIGIFLCAAFVAISLATISGITLYTAAAVIAGLAITTALGLTIGLLRILNGSPAIADHYYFLDALGLVCVAIAIAVRVAKAIIEVFFADWY